MHRRAGQGWNRWPALAAICACSCSAPPEGPAADFRRLETLATASTTRTVLIWPIRRVVNGHAVLCAYCTDPDGRAPEPLIARGDRLYLGSTMGPDRFDAMAARLCGPHWVKPLRPPPVA